MGIPHLLYKLTNENEKRKENFTGDFRKYNLIL